MVEIIVKLTFSNIDIDFFVCQHFLLPSCNEVKKYMSFLKQYFRASIHLYGRIQVSFI